MTAPLAFVGITRRSLPSGGSSPDRPEVIAKRLFDAGWKSLTVTDASQIEVAGIAIKDGKRMWWAGA